MFDWVSLEGVSINFHTRMLKHANQYDLAMYCLFPAHAISPFRLITVWNYRNNFSIDRSLCILVVRNCKDLSCWKKIYAFPDNPNIVVMLTLRVNIYPAGFAISLYWQDPLATLKYEIK